MEKEYQSEKCDFLLTPSLKTDSQLIKCMYFSRHERSESDTNSQRAVLFLNISHKRTILLTQVVAIIVPLLTLCTRSYDICTVEYSSAHSYLTLALDGVSRNFNASVTEPRLTTAVKLERL